jgi:hypothetical protein
MMSERPADARTTKNLNVSNRGPFPPELVLSTARLVAARAVENLENSELRRIFCPFRQILTAKASSANWNGGFWQ